MKQKSLKLNFIMNAILTMSSFVFPLITFPYVSRILQPDGTGKVAFATSLITYFNMFAQLGIPTYGVRACAKVRDDRRELTKTAHELLLINLLMSALAYGALAAAILFVPRMREEKALYVIISLTILLSAIGMEWLYKALEQYTYITVRSIIFKFVAMIAMFLLVRAKEDYVIYGGITILAASASNLFNWAHVHRYIDMRWMGNYELKKHTGAVFVFFAMSCATMIYTNMDAVMLGFMKTDADVGYYNAAVKIKSILVSIVTSLGTVMLPRVSYYVEHGQMEQFRHISGKAMNFVVIAAVPMMVYFMIFAREGIYFLSGSAYEGAVVPMQIIMPTLLFIGITNILGIQILVPLGKEKTVLVSEIAGAFTDLILNTLLIPPFASAGAALGTLAAELVVLLVQCAALKELAGILFRKVSYGKVMGGILCGIPGAMWIRSLAFGPFLTLLLSSGVFFGVYGVFLLLTKEKLITELAHQMLAKVLHRS